MADPGDHRSASDEDAGSEPLSVRASRSGVRLDRVLADAIGCSRRDARGLVRAGRVRLNGRLACSCPPVSSNDEIRVFPASLPPAAPPPRDAYRVLWRGKDVWVLDKPAGVHTHAGRNPISVAAALLCEHPELAEVASARREAGLVHRLDRDTSGILLAAVVAESYQRLRTAFATREVRKRYLGICAGRIDAPFVIDRPLARRATRVAPARRGERAYNAVTRVAALERAADWTLVEVEIRTGVTHQVRAHLALAGHPLLGDAKYGGPPAPVGTRGGQLLHARSIELPDGRTFSAPAAEDFTRALYRLRRFGLDG